MKFRTIINRAICLTLTASLVLLSGCAQVQSLIDEAKNAFVLDPGVGYNAQDDLDKMMAELEMAIPPSAGKLHPVAVMDNESFCVGWDSVKDAFEYAVEIKINGVTRESYTTTDTEIEIGAANAGGEVVISVIARRKMKPIQGDTYVIESPALNVSVGVYSRAQVERQIKVDYECAKILLKEGVDNGLWEYSNKLSVQKMTDVLGEIVPWNWGEGVGDILFESKTDYMKKFVSFSEGYAKKALSHAEQFILLSDSINNGTQTLNAVAVELLAEHSIGMQIHLIAANEWLEPVKAHVDEFYAEFEGAKWLTKTAGIILGIEDSTDIMLKVAGKVKLPAALIEAVMMSTEAITVQTAMNNIGKEIEKQFNENYHQLKTEYISFLKS